MTAMILTFTLSVFADITVLDLKGNKEPYRDAARHYSVKLAPGWVPIGKDGLDKVNQFMQQRMPLQNIRYEGGFQLVGQPPLSYPYILVQWQALPSSSTTYEEIERGLGAVNKEQVVKETEGALGNLMKNTAVNEMVLDREHNRVLSRLQGDVAIVGKIQGVGVGFLGKDGIVFLHCYDKAATFPATMPNFQVMLDSFQYEEGFAFQPRQAVAPLDVIPNVLAVFEKQDLLITAVAVVIAIFVLISIVRILWDLKKHSRT